MDRNHFITQLTCPLGNQCLNSQNSFNARHGPGTIDCLNDWLQVHRQKSGNHPRPENLPQNVPVTCGSQLTTSSSSCTIAIPRSFTALKDLQIQYLAKRLDIPGIGAADTAQLPRAQRHSGPRSSFASSGGSRSQGAAGTVVQTSASQGHLAR